MATDKIEQQREHFNAISERYLKGRCEENHILLKSLIWQHALSPLKELLPANAKILEPMCGSGEGLEILTSVFSKELQYEGFDYSEDVVAAAKLRAGKIWQADVTKFVPDRDDYDAAILIGGLHHVPDHAGRVVRNVSRALKPGGIFINFEPTNGTVLHRLIRERIYCANDIFDEETERAFSVSQLFGFFEKAGLECIRCTYPGLLAYTLYYNPYAFPTLNLGGRRAVKTAFGVDRPFLANVLGRLLSFATLSVWRKPDA
ncbi:MAG: class I SAM-dependent methyltransferase [Marinicaulis sp.]|nr:class I SAM-dependent methyltransferase [Marinicaulis sp.]